MNCKNITGYVTFFLVLSMLFIATNYLEISPANIRVHINWFITKEKTSNFITEEQYWGHHINEIPESRSYPRHYSNQNFGESSYVPLLEQYPPTLNNDANVKENARLNGVNKVEFTYRQ